ncbi:hypothetical protein Y032_0421g1172 [Ancylostoma ceylanicum]|uniref:Uncharacterized protein n=1 Tax=Ancylostoma ceylanicum TaxID=53326 RepID=A0A016X1C2_9BILA|nr:hypothetical protein Y032_0421g1172 [Ancylostoma ceylanicum]
MATTMRILVILAVFADSTVMESTITPSNSFEISEDAVTLYYSHTMNETIYYILRSSNVQPSTDVVEVILNTMSKNLNAATVSKILKSLDGETSGATARRRFRCKIVFISLILKEAETGPSSLVSFPLACPLITLTVTPTTYLDPAQRSNYVNVAIPRIIGLHKKMNVFIYKLAEIYGFTGEGIKIYAKLIRPMQLSSIISAALDGARNDNNTEQYNRVLALAKEIGNMDDYQNKTIASIRLYVTSPAAIQPLFTHLHLLNQPLFIIPVSACSASAAADRQIVQNVRRGATPTTANTCDQPSMRREEKK